MSDSLDSAIDAVVAQTLATLPPNFAKRGKPSALDNAMLFTTYDHLTDEDIQAAANHLTSGQSLGVSAPTIKNIRNSHHRLAQLLAGGMSETNAAHMCGFTPNRVSVLKQSPAFVELLAHYQDQVHGAFKDFTTAAGELSKDFLDELQRRLEESPDSFTPTALLEAVRTLADRSGNAPVNKSVSVSANLDLGGRLAAARERVRLVEATANVIP